MIWVGTYSGISIFNPQTKIKHYKSSINDNMSLSENVVHGIYEDKEGLLWIGTKSSGVNIVDEKNNKIYYLNTENPNSYLTDNTINHITGKGSKIYIATKKGVNILDKETKQVDKYDKSDGLEHDDVKSLLIDSKGYLWMGTSNGINILDTKTNEIINIDDVLSKKSLNHIFTKVMYEDSEGIYWIGCFVDNGLIRLDPYKQTIKSYKYDKKDDESISSNTIRSISESRDGKILIGTSYGFSILDKDTDKFENYNTEDGLSNDIVYGILVDKYDKIWLSTNLGLSKFDYQTKKFQNFTISDGLQSNEFNGNASYISQNGELIFGGINGVNKFYPDDLLINLYIPEVKFDKIEVNGYEYFDINNMEFSHDENFISISTFLPDYRNVNSVTYYVKLEGLDLSWREIEKNNINYVDLEPGDYDLRIKARSYNGLYTNESSMKFKIKPPIYASDIAKFTYIIVGLAFLYLGINKFNYLEEMVSHRTHQLHDEMTKNKDLFDKVIELERRKNSYFINLSHELRTPLNVIYSTEQLIKEFNKGEDNIEKEKLDEYMNFIGKNRKRLLDLINNIIDTSKIENGNYIMDLKENNIVEIVEESTLSLKAYVEDRGINLIVDPEIEEKIIICDSGEIERCIVNLVGNATKFTNPGGTIIVSIKEDNDRAIISVEDNGIGIDEKYKEFIFNRFNQVVDPNSEVKQGSGLGLTITSQIIKLHGGDIFVESKVGVGSKFTIIL